MSRMHGSHGSARGHRDLHAFGAERFDVRRFEILDVQPIDDGFERRHSAKHLEWHADRLV